jgi:hypothetical protein
MRVRVGCERGTHRHTRDSRRDLHRWLADQHTVGNIVCAGIVVIGFIAMTKK